MGERRLERGTWVRCGDCVASSVGMCAVLGGDCVGAVELVEEAQALV